MVAGSMDARKDGKGHSLTFFYISLLSFHCKRFFGWRSDIVISPVYGLSFFCLLRRR